MQRQQKCCICAWLGSCSLCWRRLSHIIISVRTYAFRPVAASFQSCTWSTCVPSSCSIAMECDLPLSVFYHPPDVFCPVIFITAFYHTETDTFNSLLYFVSDRARYNSWFLSAFPFSVACMSLSALFLRPHVALSSTTATSHLLVSPVEVLEGNQLRLLVCIHVPLEPIRTVFSTHVWAFMSRDFILQWPFPLAFIFCLSLKVAACKQTS